MSALTSLNLLDALTYYLVAAFIVGTILRLRNYRAILGIVYHSADRWPKLRALAQSHRGIFLRWPTLLPVLSTLLLTLANAFAAHFMYTHARVSPNDLWSHSAGLVAVLVTGGLMGFLDFRAVFVFGRFDRTGVEVMLDRAEHWLGSWKAPAIRFLTAGLIHPRRIVGEQVRQALVEASLAVNGQLWLMSIQILARATFCLSLWLTWVAALR
jgi:hypothetical protein